MMTEVPQNKVISAEKIGIICNEYVNYFEVIDCVQRSSCIIDIPIESQSGLSLRYFEAVCYNKKLLAFNKEILNSPFYNSKNMLYISNVNDITPQFFEKQTTPYHYDGRYSPIYFIEKLERIL